MSLEISSMTGTQNIGGIDQPVIGQRRIEHETRLEDGEVNLVGGILEDTETRSLSGYPWLANLPILKYFFAQEHTDHVENEIVFAITPHIVRAEEITDDNLRVIDVGTGGNIGLRYNEPEAATPNQSSPLPGKPLTQTQPPRSLDRPPRTASAAPVKP
jgi:general secretion pathway protein D